MRKRRVRFRRRKWSTGECDLLEVTELLADLQLLPVLDVPVPRLWRLENQNNCRAQPEAADLISGPQRLTSEHLACVGIRGLAEGAGSDGAEGRVGSERLRKTTTASVSLADRPTLHLILLEKWRTLSKLTRIEPTLVAPTGTIEKKPYRQRPRRATRSFRTKRSASLPTIQGDTEKSSPEGTRLNQRQKGSGHDQANAPAKWRRRSTTQFVGLWKRW